MSCQRDNKYCQLVLFYYLYFISMKKNFNLINLNIIIVRTFKLILSIVFLKTRHRYNQLLPLLPSPPISVRTSLGLFVRHICCAGSLLPVLLNLYHIHISKHLSKKLYMSNVFFLFIFRHPVTIISILQLNNFGKHVRSQF